ncbi:lycopene cyclase domain-containing protein [Microbacterium sp. bgisy189]|uniref:lycopene cyclase domain-containing protein n=1 Tax=Microbacterium sp. bgisy189 TaxID=3413798 RepID=UPI003EBE775F
MPGAYLAAIVASAAGVAALDARFRLALWRSPARTSVATAIGAAFLLVWDAAGIASGIFIKGGSDLLLGIDLAPHLPLEEPLFLLFLTYLALVVHAALLRGQGARARGDERDGRPSR